MESNSPPQLWNFPASTFTPHQLTTTSIYFDHSCHHNFFFTNDKNERQKEHSKQLHIFTCTCQKWNHDVKNETTMSKLCQTCQKSTTNPQRVNFHFVKIHAAFCLHQWKWSVRFGPLMTSMNDRFCHQNFLWMTDFVTKISTPKITLIYF